MRAASRMVLDDVEIRRGVKRLVFLTRSDMA